MTNTVSNTFLGNLLKILELLTIPLTLYYILNKYNIIIVQNKPLKYYQNSIKDGKLN